MTPEPECSDELRRLLEAVCEERITPEEAARLEELVLADPRAEALYITYLTMQADLVREIGGHTPTAARRGGEARPGMPPLAKPGGRRRSWSWMPWGLAAGAGLLAAAISGLLLRPGLEVGKLRETQVEPAVAKVPTAIRGGRILVHDREAVAMVVRLVDARWEPSEDPAFAEGRPVPACRLRLRSGLATLGFVNGVTLTLEGPADVDLVSVDRVFCRRGKLRARVPKGAEGFVVESPSSAVVDLGTEFALNVGGDGLTRVMVFEGLAEAAVLSDTGAPKHSQLIERDRAFFLDAGAGRIHEEVARPDTFAPAPALLHRELNLAPSYAREVQRSRPRGYWRFESLIDGAFPDEVAGGPVLRAHGSVGVGRGPGENGYCAFPKGDPGQYLDTEALWDLPAEPGHAVEFWFLAEEIAYTSLVGFYPPRSQNPPDMADRFVHTFFVEATAHQRQSLQKPASVRFLHRWPLDIKVKDSLFSEGFYLPCRWHHVVAQKNDGRLELYFDGQLDRSSLLESDHPTLRCHLVVGRRTPESGNPKDSRSFVGRLDELAIYDHPLSAEEVRAHHRLGLESPRPH